MKLLGNPLSHLLSVCLICLSFLGGALESAAEEKAVCLSAPELISPPSLILESNAKLRVAIDQVLASTESKVEPWSSLTLQELRDSCGLNPGDSFAGTWFRVTEMESQLYRVELGGKCGASKSVIIAGEDLPKVYRAATDLTSGLRLSGEVDTRYTVGSRDFFRLGPQLGWAKQWAGESSSFIYMSPQQLRDPFWRMYPGLEVGVQNDRFGFRIQTDFGGRGRGLDPSGVGVGVVGSF